MRSSRYQISALLAAACCYLLVVSVAEIALCRDEGSPVRPESWAELLEVEGVPNLFKVSDDLYRSAQPTAEGMRNLEDLGVAHSVVEGARPLAAGYDHASSEGILWEKRCSEEID